MVVQLEVFQRANECGAGMKFVGVLQEGKRGGAIWVALWVPCKINPLTSKINNCNPPENESLHSNGQKVKFLFGKSPFLLFLG